jgi:hypothetical protein
LYASFFFNIGVCATGMKLAPVYASFFFNIDVCATGMKLAPIFMKQSTVKANLPPVLTAEELEAQRVRREFLISGIPEELKRQQEASQSLVLCPTPAPWPTDSHIMQRQSADSYVLDPWNLPEARLTLRDCPQYQFPEITSCNNLLLGDLMSAQNENVCCEVSNMCLLVDGA